MPCKREKVHRRLTSRIVNKYPSGSKEQPILSRSHDWEDSLRGRLSRSFNPESDFPSLIWLSPVTHLIASCLNLVTLSPLRISLEYTILRLWRRPWDSWDGPPDSQDAHHLSPSPSSINRRPHLQPQVHYLCHFEYTLALSLSRTDLSIEGGVYGDTHPCP